MSTEIINEIRLKVKSDKPSQIRTRPPSQTQFVIITKPSCIHQQIPVDVFLSSFIANSNSRIADQQYQVIIEKFLTLGYSTKVTLVEYNQIHHFGNNIIPFGKRKKHTVLLKNKIFCFIIHSHTPHSFSPHSFSHRKFVLHPEPKNILKHCRLYNMTMFY